MSDVLERQKRYDEFKRRIEAPMLVLSALLIPVVTIPLIEDLSAESLRALEIVGISIWGVFVVEYAVIVYLAPNKLYAIRTHKLDLLLVVLPLLRTLRFARVLRMLRAGTAGVRAVVAIRCLARRPGFLPVIGLVGGLIVAGGGLATIVEHDQPEGTIMGIGDGLWWAFVTCTTVGYGDEFPVTSTGRLVAVVLILAGIGGLSVIAANVAAFFVATEAEQASDQLRDRLDRIEERLAMLCELSSSPALPSDAEIDKRVA